MTSIAIRRLARQLLAIKQGQGTTKGYPPSAEELAELLDGRLPSSRKQEVYSWLNRSQDLFSQWIALVATQATVTSAEQPNPEIRSSWLNLFNGNTIRSFISSISPPAFATALASILVAVVYFTNLEHRLKTNDSINSRGTPTIATTTNKPPIVTDAKANKSEIPPLTNEPQITQMEVATAFLEGYESRQFLGEHAFQSMIYGRGKSPSARLYQVKRFGRLLLTVRNECEKGGNLSDGIKARLGEHSIQPSREVERVIAELKRVQTALAKSDQLACQEAMRVIHVYSATEHKN